MTHLMKMEILALALIRNELRVAPAAFNIKLAKAPCNFHGNSFRDVTIPKKKHINVAFLLNAACFIWYSITIYI